MDGRALPSRVVSAMIVALALSAPAAARAASVPPPAVAVEQLNAWRGSVGVAPVAHDPAQDDGCRRHADYYRVNPTHTGHFEQPTAAGYSAAGDRAARSSVLGFGTPLGSGIRPWEPAPYHRMALLDPRLTSTGFWSEFGLSCMGVLHVSDDVRTATATAYTYPVNGQLGVPLAFFCLEDPNPCQDVPGNDGRTPTGFNVSVQFNGPWARQESVSVASATLAPVGGLPVALTLQARGAHLRGGLILIPNEPLRLATTYVAAVAGTIRATADDGVVADHAFAVSWSFSTPGVEPDASLRVSVHRVTRQRVLLRVDLLSRDPRRARISLLNGRAALIRVVRRLEGGSQIVRIKRPRSASTMIAVLLRGSASHAGVAARLPVHIPAVRRR